MGEGGSVPVPTGTHAPDPEAIKEIAEFIVDGCAEAAEETGFEGFRAENREALRIAKRLDPILNRYCSQVSGPTMEWALLLGSLGFFCGKRYFRFKRWEAELVAKMSAAETADTSPPPKPDATPLPAFEKDFVSNGAQAAV